MKQKLIVLLFMMGIGIAVKAQTPDPSVKPSVLAIHFDLVDFNSPKAFDTSSLRDVFKKGDIIKPNKMNPALSVSYWKGLNKYFDYSGKINAIFYSGSLNGSNSNDNGIALEMEGTINARPVGNNHFFTPLLTTGFGAGHYGNKKWGGYVPVGIGFQFNIDNQVYFLLQTQYRMTLSNTIFPNNLFHSLGVAANIGK